MSSSASQSQSLGQSVEDTPFEGDLTVDTNDDTDSAYGASTNSVTTSIASHYKGYFENGRRYQNVRSEEYFMPTDEKQWESMQLGHLAMLVLDSHQVNPLFRSPISEKAHHIIDLGTGQGDWALDVADRFPNLTVQAVDLYPPPQQWTAPNCIFEVDDVSKPWTWNHKFDLVHMRHMLGSLSNKEWDNLYKRIYDNLEPGGWIEQLESDIGTYCMDNSLPADSVLNYRDMMFKFAENSGRPVDTEERIEERIRATGFTNVRTQVYKVPIGTWPKLSVYKDAGRLNKQQFLTAVEGWCLYLLTKWGLPEPWSVEQAQVWLAQVRNEVNKGYPIYHKYTRVYAQKPYEEQLAKQQDVALESVAEASASPKQPGKRQKNTDEGIDDTEV